MPTSKNFKYNGFTLVELLVVITVIAVLTLIAISTYSGVQMKARDTRRTLDIESISKALEVNRVTTGYKSLNDSQFDGGIPASGPKGDQYCINSVLNIVKPTSSWTDCSDISESDWSKVEAGKPPDDTVQFMVCASMEDGSVFCRISKQ